MTPSSISFASATAALLLAIAASLRRPDPRTLGHPAMLGAIVLFVVSMLVCVVSVQPTLVHADLIAPELVDCVLQAPHGCTGRGVSYGEYGFLLLGTLARPFGNDLDAVFRAMGIIGALNVALLAVLALRLSGSPYGALIAVAVSGTNPIFMRVAGSEDMHNVGLCLALVALIAIDVFAVRRRAAPLAAAVLALCLMMYSRQTFYVFAPGTFLLCLARGGRSLLRCPRFWGAGVVVAAVLVTRVVGNAGSGGLVQQMVGILGEPVLLPSILRNHALLDVARFGPLPVLTVAALIWACRDGWLARAAAVVFALSFVLTYPCGMPSPGVELAQRLPVFAFGTLLAALAGAALLETRLSPPYRAFAGLSAAVALMALPPLFPGWRMLGVLTPIHREYMAVESAAAALPQEVTLVKSPTAETTVHGRARYVGLLERLGKRVQVVPASEFAAAPRPWVFLEDIECWTYSFRELTGAGDDRPTARMRELRWDRVLFARQPSPLRPPAGPRPECRPFVRDGTPIGPRFAITDPPDDPPFLFYAGSAVPIQFHELSGLASE